MKRLYQTEEIASFALNARFDNIPPETINQLKKYLLDVTVHLMTKSAFNQNHNGYD